MPRVPPVTNATRGMISSLWLRSLRQAYFCVVRLRAGDLPTSLIRVPSRISRRRWKNRSALEAHGDPHATTDAQGGEALLGVALLHLVQQRHQDTRPRRTDRMAKCDRTTVDIDFAGIPAQVLVDRAGLGRE